ncbi:hypothetical protein ACFLT2_02760 [Acidobacteriota bacterium]
MLKRTEDVFGVLSLGVLILGGFFGAAILISDSMLIVLSRSFDGTSPYGALMSEDVSLAIRFLSVLCVAAGLFSALSLAFPERFWKCLKQAKEKFQPRLIRKRSVIGVAVILVLFSSIIYAGALRIGFHSDDFAWIESTAKTIQNPGHIFSLSQSHFFRPLTFIYHTLNYSLFGNNPYALHISGILFHGLAALFIFLIVLELTDRTYLSITAALLFCSYPVSSRSVMWISGSEIVFAGLIYLISFYLFLLYLKAGKSAYYVFSILFFILGLMAKEAVISLALATLLSGILIPKRASRLSGLPFVVIGAVFLFIQLSIQADSFLIGENIYSLKPGVMIANYGGYTLASIIPLGHRVLLMFPFLKLFSLVALAVLIPAVLAIGSNLLKFLMLWFVVLLAPFMAFNLPVQPRYLYLPSFALCILFAWILSALYRKVFAFSSYRKLAFFMGLCILIGASLVQIHTASVKMRYESKHMNEYIEEVKSDPQRMHEIKAGKLPADSPLTYDHLKAALNF